MKQTQVNMDDLILMIDSCDTTEQLKKILYEKGYLIEQEDWRI